MPGVIAGTRCRSLLRQGALALIDVQRRAQSTRKDSAIGFRRSTLGAGPAPLDNAICNATSIYFSGTGQQQPDGWGVPTRHKQQELARGKCSQDPLPRSFN